jgi:hypothetical protein
MQRISRVQQAFGAAVALCLAVTATAIPAPTTAAGCLVPVADVNGDGVTTVGDVQCIVLASLWQLGGAPTAPSCLAGPAADADIDCDGEINVSDAQLSVQIVVQMPFDPAVDGDQDGCPDSCQSVQQAGPPVVVPAWFVGTASGGGLQLRSLAPGFVTQGKATGGGLVIQPKVVGATAP